MKTLNLDEIQRFFGKWYNSGPFDIGYTTKTALEVIDLNKLNPEVSYKRTIEKTYDS